MAWCSASMTNWQYFSYICGTQQLGHPTKLGTSWCKLQLNQLHRFGARCRTIFWETTTWKVDCPVDYPLMKLAAFGWIIFGKNTDGHLKSLHRIHSCYAVTPSWNISCNFSGTRTNAPGTQLQIVCWQYYTNCIWQICHKTTHDNGSIQLRRASHTAENRLLQAKRWLLIHNVVEKKCDFKNEYLKVGYMQNNKETSGKEDTWFYLCFQRCRYN